MRQERVPRKPATRRSRPAAAAGMLAAGLAGGAFWAQPAAAFEGGLKIFPDLHTLVLMIVFFALLVGPVQALLFRPLLGVLDERARRIEGARSEAARLVREARALAQRHAATLQEIRAQAEAERRQRLGEVQGQTAASLAEARTAAEEELAQARREVASSVDSARTALRTEARALADLLAERLLGRSLS